MIERLDTKAPDLWDKVANRRWGSYLTAIEMAALDKACDQFSHPGNALEVGAERGRWTRKLLDKGWTVTATDVTQEKVEVCQQHNPAAKCLLVDQEDTRFPVGDATMDLVLSIEVPINESAWFVTELARVLRPGGIAMFTLNNRKSWRSGVSSFRSRLRGEHVFYARSYDELRQDAVEEGFSILHEEGFCWLPFSRFSDSALIPWLTPLESALGLRKMVTLSPWVVSVCRKQ